MVQRGNISFSWYCRRPAEANVGTAARTGDAMLGLATVESTRPACEGTAAATLLNMVMAGVCVRRWISRNQCCGQGLQVLMESAIRVVEMCMEGCDSDDHG
jgi:hypothetical protein